MSHEFIVLLNWHNNFWIWICFTYSNCYVITCKITISFVTSFVIVATVFALLKCTRPFRVFVYFSDFPTFISRYFKNADFSFFICDLFEFYIEFPSFIVTVYLAKSVFFFGALYGYFFVLRLFSLECGRTRIVTFSSSSPFAIMPFNVVGIGDCYVTF